MTAAAPAATGAQTFSGNALARIDCFYAYPAVSRDPSPNSDMTPGPEEMRAARQQLAPFGSECRLFAPVYRQATLAASRGRAGGDMRLAYNDLRDAWNHYLATDNRGRGVVLIGHAQGARTLAELIANEVDGKPAQRQLVSALLLGTNIAVPRGRDVGGTFKSIPLCRSVSQVGCLIAYTSYRAEAAPPATATLGRLGGANALGSTDAATHRVACTNPGALQGGAGRLQGLMPARENLLGQPTDTGAWGQRVRSSSAEFIVLRDVLSAECIESGPFSYLSVGVQQAGWTAADIPGDVTDNGAVLREWGLHLVDANIAMGNLLDIVRQQAAAYRAATAP